MGKDQIHNTEILKRFDIHGKNYFFCPQTYVIFSLAPEKADALEEALKSNSVSAYRKVQEIIASKAKPIKAAEQNPDDESGVSLILTENCNLACAYCWEHGDKSSQTMSLDIALKSVDFLIDYCKTHGFKKSGLNFFGGEPLLNWKIVQKSILHAEERTRGMDTQWRFSITTNGTLLKEERIAFLDDHRAEIIISIDGVPGAHDPYRRTMNGKPSHQLVVAAIEKILKLIPSSRITVLMTVHHGNIGYIQDSIEYVRKLGIRQIGMNPVRAAGLPEHSPLTLTMDDYKQLTSFLSEKYLEYPDLESNPYKFTIRHRFLSRINLHEQRHTRCGAGRNGFSIGVDGQIYPCGTFAFGKKMTMGSVLTGLNNSLVEDYIEACGTVDDNPTCSNCWVRYLCGGGCYYESLSRQKEIRQPFPEDCLNARTMIEMALRAKIEFAGKHKT